MLFSSARRILSPSAAAAAAAVLGATVVAAAEKEEGVETAGKDGGVEWAYPSPYHAGVDRHRFRQEGRFTRLRREWDLAALLSVWTESDGEETWPWVWTWRNENGPHHVFVGVDAQTLDQCRRVAAASPQNNLTLVLPRGHPLLLAERAGSHEGGDKHGVSLADFYACRCAVVESRPAQIDFAEKVLMLEDERMICYSALTLTG